MNISVGKYKIIFSAEASKILDQHKQRDAKDNEKGGIILGRLIGDQIHVVKLSIPTELDKSSRYNFERHRLSAQIIIEYEFANSHGQLIYLGEWHTHPENEPVPSSTDNKMIRDQLTKNKIHTDYLLMLIQGLEKLYIGILDKKGLTSILL